MLTFVLLSIVLVAGALASLSLRNLVHCALSLALSFAALACLYLQLQAQFVGLAQILVYVGAVGILIVFAILLTRGSEPPQQALFSQTWWAGAAVATSVFAVLVCLVLRNRALAPPAAPAPPASVQQIGDALMTKYILPLEVVGLLLTAALIGAVIIAMPEKVVGPEQKDAKR